jgi:hypothetical protein
MQTNVSSLSRRVALTVCGAAFALVMASTGQAWSTPNRHYLTFSGSVALPGVVLPPGSYTFEVANPDTSGNVVRVSSRNGGAIFLGFTRVVERPRGLGRDTKVTFGEAAPGAPVPLKVWYPPESSTGHEFIYR